MILLEKRLYYVTINLGIFVLCVFHFFSDINIPCSTTAPFIQLGFLASAAQLYLITPSSATSPASQLPDFSFFLFFNKYKHLSSCKAESNESNFFFFFFSHLKKTTRELHNLCNKRWRIFVAGKVPFILNQICLSVSVFPCMYHSHRVLLGLQERSNVNHFSWPASLFKLLCDKYYHYYMIMYCSLTWAAATALEELM